MAPDKIYIQQDMINNLILEKQEFDDDVEYIRKDALLELLEALKAQSSELKEAGYGDVFYGAQIAILEETIHKIESL